MAVRRYLYGLAALLAVALLAAVVLAGCRAGPAGPGIAPAGQPWTSSVVMQSAVVTSSNGTSLGAKDGGVAGIQVSGTYTTATTYFEGTVDGTNWVAVQCYDVSDGSVDTLTAANGVWACPVSGLLRLRARVAWTSGTSLTVQGLLTDAPTFGTPDVDLGATETVNVANAVTVNDPISVTVGAQAPQLDDTDKLAISAYGKSTSAGDTALHVDSSGDAQVDVLSIAAGNNNIGDVDVASIAAGNNNIGDVDVASIAAGETHVGSVSSGAVVITQTPTITAGAYSANDAVGGKLTFANAVRNAGGVGYIEDVIIVDYDKENAELILVCFDADFTPTADNAAFDPSDADLLNAIGWLYIGAGDYKGFSDNSMATVSNQPLQFKLSAGNTSLYCQLMNGSGTPTYTSTGDLTVKLAIRYVN